MSTILFSYKNYNEYEIRFNTTMSRIKKDIFELIKDNYKWTNNHGISFFEHLVTEIIEEHLKFLTKQDIIWNGDTAYAITLGIDSVLQALPNNHIFENFDSEKLSEIIYNSIKYQIEQYLQYVSIDYGEDNIN